MVCAPCLEKLQTAANVVEPKPGQVLQPDNLRWSCGWELNTSFGVLRATSNECFFCRNVLENVAKCVSQTPSDDVEVKLRYVFTKYVDDSQLPYLRLTVSAKNIPRIDRIFLVEDVARVGRLVHRVKGDSTGAVEALTFLRHNFNTCLKSHEICSKLTNKPTWFPTRLIEIFDDGARLIDTNDTEPSGLYASLSHRWGTSKMFRCTTETLDGFKKRIPVSELPLTFRETFDVLRFLGIKYIWIDSICIIQDSDEDWTREAKLMMKVYQQATINIAATASSGGESGLFTKRNASALISLPFEISNGILDGQYQAVESNLDKISWDPTIEEAPLNKRGWVLQERVLSPRVAHFTADQVIWDCSDCTASESIPSGAFVRPREISLWIGRKKRPELELWEKVTEEYSIVDEWKTVVNKYSRCHLTYDSDRLIAMEGIKSSFEELLSKKVVCGLAETDLEMQLCWQKCEDSDSTHHSRTDIAPSWSWLSLKGGVTMVEVQMYKRDQDQCPLKIYVRVEDISTIKTVDHGARGIKYTGSILLRCFLNPVKKIEDAGGNLNLVGLGHCFRVDLDTPDISDHDSFYFAPVFERQDIIAKYCLSEIRGILLKLVDGASATFERCGHAAFGSRSGPETGGKFLPTYTVLMSADGKESLPCKDFDVQKGHLIEIV